MSLDAEDLKLFEIQTREMSKRARELGVDSFVGVIQTRINGMICYSVVGMNAGVVEGLGAARILEETYRTQVHINQASRMCAPPPNQPEDRPED